MADGQDKLLLVNRQELALIIKTAVQDAISEMDLVAQNQQRLQIEELRQELARARADAETQRELAKMRLEKTGRYEGIINDLTTQNYELRADNAMKESQIRNLQAESEVTAGDNE